MLKKISINNFRSLVNFELELDSLSLFLGPNGSGKSSVFEVLRKLQDLAALGLKADKIFFTSDSTHWQADATQSFAIEVRNEDGLYKYQLTIAFNEQREAFIDNEKLLLNDKPLIESGRGKAELYKSNFELESSYPLDPIQSAIPLLPFGPPFERVTWFRNFLAKLTIVQIIPAAMASFSQDGQRYLTGNVSNFASWYREVSNHQGLVSEIKTKLQEILPGFSYFNFVTLGDNRQRLEVHFDGHHQQKYIYQLFQLSDGQRALIVLYVLLIVAKSENLTLCIDEPENYLALPEIQPWLLELRDLCDEGEVQALLISHHPELINYLAAEEGIWFDRRPDNTVQAIPLPEREEGGLPMSELVARGWVHA